MSSPSTTAELAPGTVVAGLVIEPAGSVTWLWVTFFVFGNVFAMYWLTLAALNAYPEVAYQLNKLLIKMGLMKPSKGKHSRVKPTLTEEQQQKQQQKQIQQLSQQLSRAPASPSVPVDNAPAGLTPTASKPVTLHHLASVANRGSSGGGGGSGGAELSSPLRSHRSKPMPPPEICLEQTITPRAGLPLSPRLSARTSSAGDGAHSTPKKSADGTSGVDSSSVGAGDADAADTVPGSEEEEESSMFTETEDEPVVIRLEWRNLCYAVKSATGLRLIVQGIYGCANPHELQGLMGPSGAGKSTLMDLLSRRTDPTGSSTAEAALQEQQKSLTHRLKGFASNGQPRHSDGTGNSSSNATSADGGTPASPAAADAVGTVQARHHAVSVAGLQSTISPGDTLPVLESRLLVNGAPLSRKAFMKLSAYVPQHDNLVPTMTILEALSFYAGLVLPPETSERSKKKRIHDVIQMMGLSHAKDTLVGGTLPGGIMLRGLSGGERKRLAIACGLVAEPSLVFLDEPTSGLDSFAALNVVLFLKNLATNRGATLIASLHQPRSAIWGQLDQVTLLATGRLMYTGPTDQLTRWFTSLGYDYDPSTHGMASDWALDLVSLGFSKPQQGALQQEQEGKAEQEGLSTTTSAAGHQGSLRQRGLASLASTASRGLHGVGSARYSQQAAASKRCMMSSKQELYDAAAAFLQHLRVQHPDWFVLGANDNSAWGKANGSSSFSLSPGSSGQTGLTPIKVHRGPSDNSNYDESVADAAPGTTQALGDDTAASPFIMQGQLEDERGQQPYQQGQLQLTATDELEQQQDSEQGMWHSIRGGWRKYTALLWRELLITTRNPADIGGRMMTFTYVSLLSGLVAWNMPGGADSIMSRISSAYAVLSFYLLMPFVFMSLFTSDKRFFAADTTARLYHPFQYYMAKVTVTLPFNVIVAVVFHLVYYGMIGMRHGAAAMGQSCVISVLMGLTAMQAVYCCAIVASSQDLAFVYAIAWTALNLLVNPYMAMFNLYSLGWGVSWLRYFSPYNFAWQALVKIELQGRGFDCNSNSGLRVLGLIPDLLPQGGNFAQIRSMISNLGRFSNGKCVASGDAVVAMYTSGLSFGDVVGILLAYFILFLTVTYYVVWRSSKRRGSTL